jgi:hypothetical protein
VQALGVEALGLNQVFDEVMRGRQSRARQKNIQTALAMNALKLRQHG